MTDRGKKEWYSQCQPGAQAPTTTSRPTTTAGPTTTQVTSRSTTVATTTRGTTTGSGSTTTLPPPPAGSGTATWSGNPFVGVKQWANSFYRDEINEYAVPALGAKAAAVADVPTFLWM